VVIETAYPLSVTLEGTVFTGLGEGAYYISKETYLKQLTEKLGFEPYLGTLNLKLSSDYDIKTRMDSTLTQQSRLKASKILTAALVL
jgi:CTP-dependent riboflavin kinase